MGFPEYYPLAIGLPGVGGYEHRTFLEECERWSFEGIAAVTTLEHPAMERELETIASLGYRGVKVHPRLLKRNKRLDYLSDVFSLCQQAGLVCLFCTYEAEKPGALPSSDPFYQLCDALNHVPEVRLILMHGGGVRLMQYAGLARHSDSILLDLSFTLTDYMTAHLEICIRELMTNLDRRLCVGSDSPENILDDVLQRVLTIAIGLDPSKRDNILSKNLERFFPQERT